MTTVTFPISVGIGDMDVEVDVTAKELKLLKKYAQLIEDIDNGDNDEDDYPEFNGTKELSDLYNRVIDTALDEMANAAYDSPLPELYGEEYNFEKCRECIKENYSVMAEFPNIADLSEI